MNTLEERLSALRVLQGTLNTLGQQAQLVKEQIAATELGMMLSTINEQLANTHAAIKEVENEVRTLAVLRYEQDGNKNPADGVGIRVYKGKLQIRYYNDALDFAREKMPIAIIETLDEKALLAWAETQETLPDFITRDADKITATISKG